MTSDIPLTRPPLAADLSPEGEKYINHTFEYECKALNQLASPFFSH